MSGHHARIDWRGDGWTVRDLASLNGTWVNGRRIANGGSQEVRAGDELAFGDRGSTWVLEDASAPVPMCLPLEGGEPRLLADGGIALPDVEHPEVSVFLGTDGSWTLEAGERVRVVSTGEVIEAGGRTWRFSCPSEWAQTVKSKSLRLVRESTLHFEVSRDEEYVSLSAEFEGELVVIGRHAAFYLLLTLARLRNADSRTLERSEAGWVHRDDVARMLNCGEQQLNVWVYRIRGSFSNKDFIDYASIIERRDGTGQLRIGVPKNVINDGGTSHPA